MAEEDDAVEETGETRMIYARLDERDRGRAWVVLAASFLVQLLMDGTVSSYGVLLTNMRNDTKFKELGYTEAEFNIPGAIQPCLYIFMIGLACPLVNAFGFRWVAIAGGILSGLSMVISSYCQDLISFTLFFGLFTGVGFGTLSVCAVVSVTYYFDKYRAIASGIASAGNGVGYCVIPLLLDTLAKTLDWRMALLLYSIACTAIFCLAALTMKPLKVLPILTEEPLSASIAHNSQTVGTSLAENLEPSRGHTHLETVKEEEDDGAESDADSSTDHPASWSGEVTLQTEDPANIPRNSDSMPSAKRQRKRGFSMPAMPSAQLNSLMNSLMSVRRSKSGGRGVGYIKVTHTSQKRGVSGIGGRRISLFHPKRDSIGTEASFGARPRLSSLFRRKLSVQAERSLVNESLFRLTPRPSLAPRQANPATNPGHMHDFRESSLHLGNGTYIGRPMALSPLSRADSFYSASLASLRYQDRRLREAAARSSMLTETDMDVSFKSCLSFDLSASLQMSRRTTNASNQNQRRQQLLQENSTAADELAQSMLTIEGKAEPQKVAPPMFASRCRRLASFLDAHFDLSLLRSVDFWLVTSILITSQLAYFMPFVYLVEYAKECGISPREGVLLIMIIGKPSLKQAPKNVALSAC
ncbi:hypothetical protein AAHC03_01787 [Spirometra sp. Aus1]